MSTGYVNPKKNCVICNILSDNYVQVDRLEDELVVEQFKAITEKLDGGQIVILSYSYF